jgi:hypothetical protein
MDIPEPGHALSKRQIVVSVNGLISSVTRSPTMWLTHAQYGPARHFRMEALGYHTQIPRPWLKLYPTYVGLRIWRISCRLSAAR